MINFNNIIKMCFCITISSGFLLAILAILMGFVDNTVVDVFQLIMKICMGSTIVGGLGMIGCVLYNECYYSTDPCCPCYPRSDYTALDESPLLSSPPAVVAAISSNTDAPVINVISDLPSSDVQPKKNKGCILQ